MPKVRQYTVYTYDELSDSAKENARDWARENLFDHAWYDGTYDDVKAAAACFGLDIDKIYFSGFWNQGDGACFEGRYEYKKDWKEALTAEFGGDYLEKLIDFGQQLEDIQKECRYGLSCRTKQSGHYMHSGCMDVDVEIDPDNWENVSDVFDEEQAEEMMHEAYEANERPLIDFMRSYADWIYRKLEEDYDFQTADDELADLIKSNEYEFDEDGNFA